MTMWKHWDLPRDEGTRLHRIGDVQIYVAMDIAGEGEVLATLPIYPETTPAARKTGRVKKVFSLPPLSDPVWTRYFMGGQDAYAILPSYPRIPVCVRLSQPFLLPPGTDLEGWIFSRIEATIMVGDTQVSSYPLAVPYKTLYGTPDAGVVCRYDEAEFLAISEPVVSTMHADPRFVAHPVRLRNTSSSPLLVSDLCIYGEQLSIFELDSMLQSERILFSFSASGVRMSLDGQSPMTKEAKTLVKPTVSGEERFIVRSFELLKTMTRL